MNFFVVQHSFHKFLCAFYSSNWANTLWRKMSSLPCVEISPDFFSSSSFKSVVPLVRSLGPRGASAVVKACANPWVISSRMREHAVLPCVFGCGAVDSFEHYLSCDALWILVISCTHGRSELLQDDSFVQIGEFWAVQFC